jgi:hypothetical protein
MRIVATLALLAAIVGGVAFEARAYTCNTYCYTANSCTTTCF